MQPLKKLSAQEAVSELSRRYLEYFIATTKPNYEFNWHHKLIIQKLQDFKEGKIKKLIIFAPPQHGKSELSTRRFTPWLLGHNPNLKIAIISYSAGLAQGFNRDIQRIIDDPVYSRIFPDTKLPSSQSGYMRNMEMFEMAEATGSVRTVGVDGALTGFPVDIAIFDDLYKNREEALSDRRQEVVRSFWDSVLMPRLHNNSQILGTFTRWSEDDLGGYLIKTQKDWTVINIPAIKEKEDKSDPRKIGEALWPKRHSLDRLLDIKKSNAVVFNSLYQQNPGVAKDILVFPKYTIIDHMPADFRVGCGIDFGFSNDPTAIIDVGIHNNSIFLDELVYKTGLINKEIKIEMVLAGVNLKSRHVADPAEPKSIKELQLDGVNVIGGKPASVYLSLAEMKKRDIYVTRRSHNLINELNNYQFRVVAGRITNEVMPGKDHAIDAARYRFFDHIKPQQIKI